MKVDDVIAILDNYNLWRRGVVEILNTSPEEIGEAIDAAVQHLMNSSSQKDANDKYLKRVLNKLGIDLNE